MMMEVVYVAVAALSLLSVGQSAPVTSCEPLTQPIAIQGGDQLLGKWMYIAESTNIAGSRLLTKLLVDSAWGKITAANESDVFNHYQVQKMFGRCFSVSTKLILQNNTLSMEQPYAASATLLSTGCSDCLVLFSKSVIAGSTYSGMQLMSRRREVSVAERQEFVKQVECMNLTLPAVLNPEKDLCPDDSSSEDSETIDLTKAINDMPTKLYSELAKIMTSEDGIGSLIQLISSGGD